MLVDQITKYLVMLVSTSVDIFQTSISINPSRGLKVLTLFSLVSPVPSSRVDMKMPPHYPPYYDYSDLELGGGGVLPSPTVSPAHPLRSILTITIISIILILVVVTVGWFLCK